MEDFERICERVGNVRDEAVAQGARIVHRTKQVTVGAKTGEKLYNVQSKFKPRILTGRSRDCAEVQACSPCSHTGQNVNFSTCKKCII